MHIVSTQESSAVASRGPAKRAALYLVRGNRPGLLVPMAERESKCSCRGARFCKPCLRQLKTNSDRVYAEIMAWREQHGVISRAV